MIKNITILGAGAMGSRIAIKLLEAGYKVAVYNRSKNRVSALVELGAEYFDTPFSAVISADLVISMLTNDKAAHSVWLDSQSGAIHGMKPGAIAIESSTLSVECVAHLSEAFAQKGVDFLDAPVVGSRPQADAGVLVFLVGGCERVLAKTAQVLSHLSSAVYYLGESGKGAIMKLAVNAYFGVQVAALSEVTALLQKSGIDKQQSVELLNKLPVTSPALQGIGVLIEKNNFQPFFPIALVEKDFSYMLNYAKQLNVKLPTIFATHTSFQSAIEQGFAEDNIAGVAQLWLS
ncbi:3-hydroxyisobutyrate dehydrogenase family protein [hydrothermal vent metagenome]|uniref:3-hydroxyisobutyrate dehydrogenase family protein n=1 Tax=hydrothermal vent metagenome TaxID=652676 RepID=A0A3B0XMX6_9ZZZZ